MYGLHHCPSASVAAFVTNVLNYCPDERRGAVAALEPRLVDLSAAEHFEDARAFALVDFAVRAALPKALDALGLRAQAEHLGTAPRVDNDRAWRVAHERVRGLRLATDPTALGDAHQLFVLADYALENLCGGAAGFLVASCGAYTDDAWTVAADAIVAASAIGRSPSPLSARARERLGVPLR